MLQCVAVCCGVLQCVALCCGVLQGVVACCRVLQCVACVAVCCSVLQCVAVCCSVLQCYTPSTGPNSSFMYTYTPSPHIASLEGLVRVQGSGFMVQGSGFRGVHTHPFPPHLITWDVGFRV